MRKIGEFTIEGELLEEYQYLYDLYYRDRNGEVFEDEKVILIRLDCGCEVIITKKRFSNRDIHLCSYHAEMIHDMCEEEAYAYLYPEDYLDMCEDGIRDEVAWEIANFVVEVLDL